MREEEIYGGFVERYFETGDTDVPAAWPEEVRARCLFFLKLIEGSSSGLTGGRSSAGLSLLSSLQESGVEAGVHLPAAGDLPPPSEPALPRFERYLFERELARGGMGRILLAYDRDFRRRIAVKVLLGAPQDRRRASRFLQEAQATAQLEHPNIAPVYDLGLDAAGSPFFTMKWIRGRDLHQIIAAGDGEFSLIRQVQILQQAAMGVQFANARGVIHRDLKPRNVMVGDCGEVLVVDWGLAKILSLPDRGQEPADAVSTEPRPGEEGLTLEGAVQGSPAYMAPEQARGEVGEIDARTDVFGLGAMLYEILTGSPPYSGPSFHAVFERARRGGVVPPRERAPDRAIPPALDAACGKALAPSKADRFQSAKDLHDALQAYVEGIHDAERRAAEAARLRGIAARLVDDLRDAEGKQAELATKEAAMRTSLADSDPEEKKMPLWDLAARLHAAQEVVSKAFNRATAAYMAVLSIEPEDRASRAALSDIYFQRLAAAEARGDREAAALYEGLVEQHDDGRYRLALEGQGILRLASEPPGAAVHLSRFEERGPFLEASTSELLGEAPLAKPLPRGSYLAVLRLPGRVDARFPFLIGRSSVVEARVHLEKEGSIPDGFVQVPGGLTIVGGAAGEHSSLPRGQAEVGDLFAGRYPVTLEEYCRFLNEGFAADPAGAQEHIPSFGREQYAARGPDGDWAPISRLDPRVPVLAVGFACARRYCQWLGSRLKRRIRLLEEVEWERCARGADGRIFPWGNGFDWALLKGGLSRPGEPYPEPVGSFPRDVSPFGVRDLAGGVREFCEGWYSEGYRVQRGGSWFNPVPYFVFRADWRSSLRDGSRATDVGFRVGYDLRSTPPVS